MTETKQEVYVVHVCLSDVDVLYSFSTKQKALNYVHKFIADSESDNWKECPKPEIQGMWYAEDAGYIYLEKTILNET